jgi:hypothetical protein
MCETETTCINLSIKKMRIAKLFSQNSCRKPLDVLGSRIMTTSRIHLDKMAHKDTPCTPWGCTQVTWSLLLEKATPTTPQMTINEVLIVVVVLGDRVAPSLKASYAEEICKGRWQPPPYADLFSQIYLQNNALDEILVERLHCMVGEDMGI